MRLFSVIFYALIITLYSCEDIKETSSADQKNPKDSGAQKSYFSNGKVSSVINYKNGKRHGLAKDYYESGKLRLEVQYKNGVKHGKSVWYYKNEKIYEKAEYKNGKLDGVRKRYYRKGELMSEQSFKKGMPGVGLKEYTRSGKVREQPEIIIRAIDNLEFRNEYILEVSLSDNSAKVDFYRGELENGYINYQDLFPLLVNKGVAKIRYKLGSGGFVMEKVHIVAVKETPFDNTLVATASYNLAIDN